MKNEVGAGGGKSDGKKPDEGGDSRTGTGGHRYLIPVGLGIVLLAVVALTMRSAPPPDRSPQTVPHEPAARKEAMQIADADSPTDHEQDFHAEPPPADSHAADPNAAALSEQPSKTPRPRPTPWPDPPEGKTIQDMYEDYKVRMAADARRAHAAKHERLRRMDDPAEIERIKRRREQAAKEPPLQMSQGAANQIARLRREAKSLTPAQAKIHNPLLYEIRLRGGYEFPAGYPELQLGMPFDPYGTIVVDVNAEVTISLMDRIEELGGVLTTTHPRERLVGRGSVQTFIPSAQLETMASEPGVRNIMYALPAMTRADTVSEGDAAHVADVARARSGTGKPLATAGQTTE